MSTESLRHEAPRKRPAVLVYRHYVTDHFAHREQFEKHAEYVRFGGALNEDDAHGATWGYTPPSVQDLIGTGKAAYVVSAITEQNKFSTGYNACTGIVATGIDEATGRPVSFLSHGDPYCLLGTGPVKPGEQEPIHAKLRARIREMRERCRPESLAFEIVGGGFTNGLPLKNLYGASIIVLGTLVEEESNTRARVTFGPNNELERTVDDVDHDSRLLRPGLKNTDVYVDTRHRATTIVRPEQRNDRWNNGFLAPRTAAEFVKLFDTDFGAADGILPFGHNTTPSLELWMQDRERWKQIYNGNAGS